MYMEICCDLLLPGEQMALSAQAGAGAALFVVLVRFEWLPRVREPQSTEGRLASLYASGSVD